MLDDRTMQEQTKLRLLATTYCGSMAWAFGAGGWMIAGATVLGFVGSAWYFASRSSAFSSLPPETKGDALAEPAVDQSWASETDEEMGGERPSLDELDRQIARTASLADSHETVMALFAFRKEYDRLSIRTLDTDLETESDLIADEHFGKLMKDYSKTRRLCTRAAATAADETLRNAAVRLTARLAEIAEQQNGRNVSGLTTTGNYLRNRHPVEGDDPFA